MSTEFTVFLAANEADDRWLAELCTFLKPFANRGIRTWSVGDLLKTGRQKDALQAALARTDLAVLLVSADFLAEEFALGNSLHALIGAGVSREIRPMKVLWVPVGPSAYEVTDISEYSPLHDPRRPLDVLRDAEAKRAVPTICKRILHALAPEQYASPAEVVAFTPEENPLGSVAGASEEQNYLYTQLIAAVRQRNEMRDRGADTAVIDARIHYLRTETRRGLPLHPGHTLNSGRYGLVRAIGTGGFATVWLADDRVAHTKVAIKVLHPQYARQAERRDWFFHGAQAMSRLQHEAIVAIVDARKEELDHLYFVMAYVDGETLEAAVLAGRLQPAQGIAILLKVADALTLAHAHGLLHRDIKPLNILVDRELRPYLTDFDLVHAVDAAGIVKSGTTFYSAPELTDDDGHVDARADVYSLAMTAVFVLRGRNLTSQVLHDISQVIDALAVHAAVRDVLRRALAWRRDERIASMAEFRRALAEAWEPPTRTADPIPVLPPNLTPPPPKPVSIVVPEPTPPPPRVPAPNPTPVVIAVVEPTPPPIPDPIVVPEPNPTPIPGRRVLFVKLAALVGVLVVVSVAMHQALRFFQASPTETDTSTSTTERKPDLPNERSSTTHTEEAASSSETTSAPPPDLPTDQTKLDAAGLQRKARKDSQAAVTAVGRTCGTADKSVIAGDRLEVMVRVDGAKGKATITLVKPHTMWPDVVRCITQKLEARKLSTFPGKLPEYKLTLKLK